MVVDDGTKDKIHHEAVKPDLKTSLARQMLYTRNYEKYRQGLKVVARTEQAQKAEQYREKQVTLFFQSKSVVMSDSDEDSREISSPLSCCLGSG